ncbi:MAG: histidine--tRNA ligase [Sediminibacterium sp.]|nr:histidine--tRNA ligase [Sediminibacterium sp.]
MNLNPPQGSRDFNAETLYKRQEIMQTIKTTFETYCYEPLESPAMEYTHILEGKYGDEGDKLIFRVLNSGNPIENIKIDISEQPLKNIDFSILKPSLTEKALRYDLTIPFARYVANNHNKLSFPFKRYQIQPVWRGDRPQKGRYREFYQCDADVVGKPEQLNNLNYEKELVLLYHSVFQQLEIPVTIRINHRGIIQGIVEICNQHLTSIGNSTITDQAFCGILDKLDKMSWDKVAENMQSHLNLDTYLINLIKDILNNNHFEHISKHVSLPDNMIQGWQKLNEIKNYLNEIKNLKIDFSLARGLNYYTGMIVEVIPDVSKMAAQVVNQIATSSIGGGGRYDQLTAMFGVPNICGIGISFGLDRIYDIKEALGNWKSVNSSKHKILILNFGNHQEFIFTNFVQSLRNIGIACDLYPNFDKIDKQFKYGEKYAFRYAIIFGETEFQAKTFILKDLILRQQESYQCIDKMGHFCVAEMLNIIQLNLAKNEKS